MNKTTVLPQCDVTLQFSRAVKAPKLPSQYNINASKLFLKNLECEGADGREATTLCKFIYI